MEGLTPEQMQQMQQQCIFCHIVHGKVASKKVYEDDKVIAVLDINPANPGHIVIITKEHYMVMPQIPDDVVQHIGMVAKALSHALLRALKADGTSIFIANGVVAGQRAQHFMLHIIPRMEQDGVGINLNLRDMDEANFRKVRNALITGVEKHLGKIEGIEIEEEPKEGEKKETKEETKPKDKEEEKEEKKEEVKEEEKEEKKEKTKEEKKESKEEIKEEAKEEKEETKEEEPEEKDDGKPNLDDIAGLFK